MRAQIGRNPGASLEALACQSALRKPWRRQHLQRWAGSEKSSRALIQQEISARHGWEEIEAEKTRPPGENRKVELALRRVQILRGKSPDDLAG